MSYLNFAEVVAVRVMVNLNETQLSNFFATDSMWSVVGSNPDIKNTFIKAFSLFLCVKAAEIYRQPSIITESKAREGRQRHNFLLGYANSKLNLG